MSENPLYQELGPDGESCGSCVWAGPAESAPVLLCCRRHYEDPVEPAWPACAGWEAPLECTACGACCRSVRYVMVEPENPALAREPEHFELRNGVLCVKQIGERCLFLNEDQGRWTCRIYPERPHGCRVPQPGDLLCRWARRLHGLSR